MSKEKKETQMSLWEGSPANQCQSQVKEKEQMTTAISGQKCLDSLNRSNPNSLLGRMCKELLTSKTAWYSDRCKTTWKVKVSKSNVSLFQLQASVLGTRGTESGLWATPNTMDYLPPRSKEGTLKLQQGHRKGRTRPANLREQVDPETMKMYPTPNARDWKDSVNKVPPSVGKTRGHSLGQRIAADQEKRMYPTPRSSGQENPETLIKRKGIKAAAQHNLTAAVKMYPTPTVGCEEGGEQSDRVERTKSGGFILRKKNKPESTFGAKLSDAMLYLEKEMRAKKQSFPTPTAFDSNEINKPRKPHPGGGQKPPLNQVVQMYYSPTTNDGKNVTFPISQKNRTSLVGDMIRMDKNKPGGKLNPTFVEFLMGFPMNWTKTEQIELRPLGMQSSHKSQESLDSQSKKFYRTPTAMDKGDNSFKYAAKFIKGKTKRSSKENVQMTLSMDVAIEHLKNNQHLIDQYDEKFKTRPHLPPKDIFLKYLKENLDKKKLIEDDIIKKTTIDHWLRSDHCFAYPTVEYWNMIKPYLKEIKFDKEMTTEIESDWE